MEFHDFYEILWISELNEDGNRYIGKKIRTLGILDMISTFTEYVHLDHVKESTLYQILGEIQENSEGIYLKARLMICAEGMDSHLYETVIAKRREYIQRMTSS